MTGERDLDDALDALPVDARDRPWLALSLVPACVAVAVYLATNPSPAYGAGLYAQIAAEIAANGYLPPATIPGYTADGVPFAYPPLQFYAYAVLLDLGADPVAVARFLPSVAVVAVAVPVYLLGRDIAGSRAGGAAAATLVAVNPQILEWHVSAGGVVRAFAFLYAMSSIYAGYRAYITGSRRGLVAGAVLFGLTALSHPTYALFVVASYVVLWATLDRSPAGLLRGLAVGLGGTAVASPWLAWAVATHGPGVFGAAAGTHGGVGGGAALLAGELSPFTLVPLAAAAYLLARGDRLLPAWVVVAELLFKQPRFAYTVGAVALATVAVDLAGRVPDEGIAGATDRLTHLDPSSPVPSASGRPDARAVLAALAILVATAVGGAALGYEMTLASDPSTPEFVDGDDREAMAWIAGETPPDATFVVVGDAAEWLPALTGRTLLVGPWGVEWREPGEYERQFEAFETLSACHSAECVESAAATVGADPGYVYLPKGRYTVRGESRVTFGTLNRSFAHADGWTHVYENDGVVVYRSTGTTEE
ncbi:glycosyltransferase family 39 protein [Halobaculum magnesiiphilum]|uniref:Glycosyltransferase family 39 protein n=1 Tax=Halobaculum magnesiiphilum TaxID=1017351 RepID=A0A8T8WAB6_9EURY|nr:glycosyltransferase family 39 protein [Halobaculum magnesiiphilum]QZP36771.1 glycosyltransferase family 39 protein [Halobaculum magnesiiphilum]